MIEAVVGEKGSGKTLYLLEEMNKAAAEETANIVFIECGYQLSQLFPYSIRMIDINEYPVRNYDGLLAFIAGLNAKDYDISHVFIDNAHKLANELNSEEIGDFLEGLEELARKVDNKIIVSISCDYDCLSEKVRDYVRKLA